MTSELTTERRQADIEGTIATAVAAELELASRDLVELDAAFTDLGLDSTGVVAVAGEVSDELGVPVAPETLFDYPTIRQLAHHIAVDSVAVSQHG